jgi:transposase
MLGRKERSQLELFITGSLRQLVPNDHVLVRVDRVLDLSWLRGEVADCYCCDDGRPGIDPEVAVRLMLAGLLTGFIHGRKLMREAHVNIAIRWFAGYALHEKLPDHSSLTRIRQRRDRHQAGHSRCWLFIREGLRCSRAARRGRDDDFCTASAW